MMSIDERKAALRNIERVLPSIVFDRLISILPMVKGCTNDILVEALGKSSTNPTHAFTYLMRANEPEESITPIREILDLCEGWFITSKPGTCTSGRVSWRVKSIIGEKLSE